jgi:hypothetical protein
MAVEIGLFALGALIVFITIHSAIRTFVLPRGERVLLTKLTFAAVLQVFRLSMLTARTYHLRDRRMALYAPVALLATPVVWTMLVIIGYACMYRAMDVYPFEAAVELSGSSLLTLGTVPFLRFEITLLQFSEAVIGLGLIALLLAYLPTMYNAFSAREAVVSMLEVRAGSPPSATNFILRLHRNFGLHDLTDTWIIYERWFVQIEESHTSLAALVYFRSPVADRSWITAAGAVLDTAAIILSSLDVPYETQAALTIRSGFLALRRIADLFGIPYNPNSRPGDPISISREEFDEVIDQLAEAGVPLKADRDECWRNFAGWRVNYDAVLLQIALLVYAPYAPWSSDRSLPRSHRMRLR